MRSFGPVKIVLGPKQFLFIIDRSKAILLLPFYVFCVLGSFFVLFEPFVHFHSFSYVEVTEWPPIWK